jgi:hypothetical protein
MIGRQQIARCFVVLAAAAAAFTGSASVASDSCASANVPGPIVLPDGTAYAAGRIRVCLTERLSPVAGLHETSVAGLPVGMFLSRLVRVEATSESRPDPLFYFLRTQDGVWVLEAYSMPVGKRVIVYQLRKTAMPSPRMAATISSEGTSVVLNAALGR